MDIRRFADAITFSETRCEKISLFESSKMACSLYCLLPGQSTTLRSHAESDKLILCVRGRITVTIGRDEEEIVPESGALVPAGQPHTLRNDDDAEAVAFVVLAPRP